MSQMTCAICGGTDLVMQGGVFVCQGCGCKYSVEDAKRMMGNGESTAESKPEPPKASAGATGNIDNLLELAGAEMESGNFAKAVALYDQVIGLDANCHQAWFHKGRGLVGMATLGEPNVRQAVGSFEKAMEKAPESELGEVKVDIDICLQNFGNAWLSQVCETFIAHAGGGAIDTKRVRENFDLARQVLFPCLGKCGADIDQVTNQAAVMLANAAIELYKSVETVRNTSFCGSYIDKWAGIEALLKYALSMCTESAVTNKIAIYKALIQITADYESHSGSYMINGTRIPSKCSDEAKQRHIDNIMEYHAKIKELDPDYVIPERPQPSSGGCYIATCVYGDYDCPQVWTLRRFRDNILAETAPGRWFIRTYYAISPTLVKWFGHTAWFKKLWKAPLDKLVTKLRSEGVEDTPYKDK